MTINTEKKLPDCFGILDIVFPKGKDNLRHSPESCLECTLKTECLKKAMQGEGGVKIKEESLERAYQSGVIGFFERWSKKKYLTNKMKQIK
ncbi:MAG: hypothetical protein HQK76_11175 [Desulfobacterales bacterium]|nr:hypothetical protein [Desulfobacterales bacterium]